MKRNALSLLLLLVLTVPITATAATSKKSLKERRIERGRYLSLIGGCHDCHTPKNAKMEPEMSLALSGRPQTTMAPTAPAKPGEISVSPDLTAWYGPWGISYTANLTPDPVTGLGRRYNEASFIKAIRSGKKPEGEPILPPMPWQMYANMTDEDLKSLYAYLRTLKPIANNVKSAVPAPASSR